MRSFGPDDPVQPLLPPSLVVTQTQAQTRGAVYYMLGFSVFLGFMGWRTIAGGQSSIGIMLLAMAVLLVVVGIRFYAGDDPGRPGWRQLPGALGAVVLLLILVMVGALALSSWRDGEMLSAVLTGGFAVLLLAMGLWITLLQVQSRRVARQLRSTAQAASAAPDGTGSGSLPGPAPAALALDKPPLRLDFYLQQELPPLPWPCQPLVTGHANILGQPPQRILYLYNFFSEHSVSSKLEAGWRRFGPVYFLGSPQEVSYRHPFSFKIGKSVTPLLLTSCAAFDERLASAVEAPLPPGDKNLGGLSYLTGGYPQHSLLCTDHTWQYGVTSLFRRADAVVIDASGYRPERAGLNWELGYVLEHVPTERFVVLVDEETDQIALAAHFRERWSAMTAASPNNRPGAGPIRFVVLKPRATGVNQDDAPSLTPPDPAGVLAKLNGLQRHLLAAYYPRYLEEDPIYGLLLGPLPKPAPAPVEAAAD